MGLSYLPTAAAPWSPPPKIGEVSLPNEVYAIKHRHSGRFERSNAENFSYALQPLMGQMGVIIGLRFKM